jgi:hypothetical protein
MLICWYSFCGESLAVSLFQLGELYWIIVVVISTKKVEWVERDKTTDAVAVIYQSVSEWARSSCLVFVCRASRWVETWYIIKVAVLCHPFASTNMLCELHDLGPAGDTILGMHH